MKYSNLGQKMNGWSTYYKANDAFLEGKHQVGLDLGLGLGLGLGLRLGLGLDLGFGLGLGLDRDLGLSFGLDQKMNDWSAYHVANDQNY